ncbi:MAG: hypothetical protein AB7I35_01375 [Ramlibacter sp.]
MLDHIAAMARHAGVCTRRYMPDALMLLGAASVAYGAWLVYPPAGFIVAGGLSLAAGVLAARLGGGA